MARVLHLLTTGDSALALDVIDQQRAAGDVVSVVLLPGAAAVETPSGVTVERAPDDLAWDTLLERIFAADQVITW